MCMTRVYTWSKWLTSELRAYTLLMVTDLALVSKTAPGQVLLFVGTPRLRHAGGGRDRRRLQ